MKLKLISITLLILVLFFSLNSVAKKRVTIFILDSKVDYNFVKNGAVPATGDITHGSIVGRIIYQEAPTVNLLNYNIDTKQGIDQEIYLTALEKILNYKQKHPKQKVIVNISLSFIKANKHHQQLIKSLNQAGVMVIAAAGNDSSNQLIYPAGFKETIAVGNATKEAKAPSSNYGEFIDLCAPGSVEYISRLYLPQGVTVKSLRAVGTSFSAPRVVGLLAKLLKLAPDLTPQRGIELIKANSDRISDSKFEQGLLGAGVINKNQTLTQVDSYYYMREFGPLLILAILLGGGLVYWVKKYKVVGVFLSLLLFLVIVPVMILGLEVLFSNLQFLLVDFQQFDQIDYLYFFFSLVLLMLLTTWQQRFLLLSYLGWFILLVFLVAPIREISLALNLYFKIGIIVWGLLLFIWEKWQLKQVKNSNRLNNLIKYLFSRSKQVTNKAKTKLKNNNFSLDSLLLELSKNNSPKSMVKKIVIGGNNNIINKLIDCLNSKNQLVVDTAVDLLGELESDLVLTEVKKELSKVDSIEKQIALLKVIAQFGKEGRELVTLVKSLLFSNNQMWLRYQALKTLTAIHPEPEKLKEISKKLTIDSQELVRLEAEKIYAKLKE